MTTRCFVIVIRNHPASERYFKTILPSWTNIGWYLERFDATTPDSLPSWPLNFDPDGCKQKAFTDRGFAKQFTPTEKACWYSHYLLWKKCAEMNERILILEHDAMVVDPSLIKDRPDYDFWQVGTFLSAYFIAPELARWLCYKLEQGEKVITLGALGFLHDFTKKHRKFVYLHPSGREWKTRWTENLHPIHYGVKQAYIPEVKNTIDHWEGTAAEPYADEFGRLFKYRPELIIESDQ